MKEERDDLDDGISYRTNIKFPISIIFLGMVGLATWSFSQWQAHLHYDNERFKETRDYIDKKTAERYTAVEARQYQESVKQRLYDIEKTNEKMHESIQRQLNSLQKQIDRLGP